MIFFGIILLCSGLALGSSASPQFDPSRLNNDEMSAVVQLRALLKNKINVDYISQDYYLAKWLYNRDFNIEIARQTLEEYLDWRTEHRIDTVLEEDWEQMRVKFPYSRNIFDKEGRPVMYIDIGDWNMCEYLAEGSAATTKLARYIRMISEESAIQVSHQRAKGNNIHSYMLVGNNGGFDTKKHGCPEFLQFMREVRKIGNPAPHNIEVAMLVNVPLSFKSMFSAFKDRTFITLFGQDRSVWEAALLEYINADQLPTGLFKEPEHKDNAEGLLNWGQA